MSVTALYMPFKEDFEPLVRIGENIAVPTTTGEYEFYRVKHIEPVQPVIIPVDLQAYQRNAEKTLEELKLNDNEAGQWRLWVLDYAAVKMNYPRSTRRWTTKGQGTQATPLSMAKENVLEFYTHEDDVPVLYLDNPLGEDQTVRVAVWGFKYVLEKLEETPKEYTVFPTYEGR